MASHIPWGGTRSVIPQCGHKLGPMETSVNLDHTQRLTVEFGDCAVRCDERKKGDLQGGALKSRQFTSEVKPDIANGILNVRESVRGRFLTHKNIVKQHV